MKSVLVSGEENVAVYAGSFDPPTLGHVWMIQRGAELFSRLIVAVGVNPSKHPVFPVEERLEMLREITQSLPNITVDQYTNQFLVRYARQVSAGYILRGMRNPDDFSFELAMQNVNADLDSAIQPVYLMPPRELAEVSSSLVRGLVGPEGWEEVVAKYVPSLVFARLRRLSHATNA